MRTHETPAHERLIVLTRDSAGNRRWAGALEKHGFTNVYSLPTIATAPASLTPELARALTHLPKFDWILFTSAAGVSFTHQLLAQLGVNITTLTGLPAIAAVGERTAAAVRQTPLPVAFQPIRATAAALAAELPSPAHQQILILRTSIADPALTDALRRRGATVTDLAVYRTQLRRDPDPQFVKLLHACHIHTLVFASPSAVQGLASRLNQDPAGTTDLERSKTLPAVTIGPTTTAAARSAGFVNVHEATQPNLESLIATIHNLP